VLNGYFQDQWKATPKLTVNLGLRYDRSFMPQYGRPADDNQYVGDYDFSQGVYLLEKTPGSCVTLGIAPCIPGGTLPDHVEMANGPIFKSPNRNFGPRLGLAYRLFPKTALRGSFGIFYENWAGMAQTTQGITGTWPSVSLQNSVNLNMPTAAQPLPTVRAQNSVSAVIPAPTPFNQVTWFMDPKLGAPYSQQWNMGIEHQLNENTLITANYVGSGTRHLPISGAWNAAVTPGPGPIAPREPYPYITPTYYDRPWGNSSYNAFQFQLNKRYSAGFGYTIAYTWSKTIDSGCSGWYGVPDETCMIENPYDFQASRSLAEQDVPQSLSASWMYEFPIGKGKRFDLGNRVANYILGNWQFNGLTTEHSGSTYTPYLDGDIANTGNFSQCCSSSVYERPNLVGNPKLSNPTIQAWFNKAAFAAPAPFTFGNLGRDTMRSDWFKDVDLSLFREVPLTERAKLVIRLEVFNAFNTPVFYQPNADFDNPNFGTVTGIANSARDIQLGAKITF